MASWIQRSLGLRPRWRRIRRRKIAGLNRGALSAQVVRLEERVLLAATTNLADLNGDTDQQNASSNAREYTTIGNRTFFTYNSQVTNKPLIAFKDASTGQTTILPDQTNFRFSPNTQISELTVYNGKLYFVASDGNPGMGLGSELWCLDNPNYTVGSQTPSFTCITDYDGTHATNVNGVANGAINGKQTLTDGSATNFSKNEGSAPAHLTVFKGKLYFTASDDPNGLGANRELYVYDDAPVTGGVKLLKDINTSSNFLAGSSDPQQLTNANDIYLYFTAVDTVGNGRELWRTDGTTAGTIPLGDNAVFGIGATNIRPGGQAPGITEITAATGGVVYFSANDGSHGYELWRSDGNQAGDGNTTGTFMVKDIQQAFGFPPVNQGSNPSSLLFANGKLYFAADDGIIGKELWVSTGLKGDATLIKDIAQTGPGGVFDVRQNSNPHNLTKVVNGGNTYIYFSANDGKEGFELWKTDGTAAGTAIVHTVNDPNSADPAHLFAGINRGKTSSGDATAGSYPGSLLDVSGVLYFIATDIYTTNGQTNFELYKVDPAGTGLIQQVGGQINTVVNEWQSQFDIPDPQQDFTYAKASADSFHPTEVIQDKSPTGFRTDASNKQLFLGPGGLIYFTADNGANGSTSRFYGDHVALNGQTVGALGAYNPNFEPWSFNTATSTASIVQDMNQQSLTSLNPFGFTTVTVTLGRDPITFATITQTRTFFFFTDPRSTAKKFGLAFTDSAGKTTDTGLRFDSIGTTERPNPVVFGNNSILFIANGKEVWRTNGQMTGTEVVASADISIDLLTVSGNRYYYYGINWSFVNNGQQQNGELWSGRAGVQAAELVQEIAPVFQNQQHSAGIKFIVPRQSGGIWFNANDFGAPNNGSRDVLWVSNPDDNAIGTRIVVSGAAISGTNPTGPQGPRGPYTAASSGNTVYFAAGTTLYRSQIFFNNGAYDGGAVDQFTNAISLPLGTISDVTTVTGGVYFVVNGRDLYFSDGTPAGGSVLVGNFTSLSELKATGNRLYFVDNGSTVYTSTATALPAVPTATPINAVTSLFNINNLVITGNSLYFSAFSGAGGQELWLSSNQLEPTQVTDIRPGGASSLNFGFDIYSHVAVGNGRVFFGANDAAANELANSIPIGGSTVTSLANVVHPTTASSQARDFIVYDADGFGGSVQPSVFFFSDVGPQRSVLAQLSTNSADPSGTLILRNIDTYRDWGGSPGQAIFFDDYSAVETQSEVLPFQYEHFGEYGHPQSDFGIYRSGKTALATRTNGGYLGAQFLFFSGFNGDNTGGTTPFMYGQELYVLYGGEPVRITDLRVASTTLQGNANPGYLTSIGNDADGESTFVLFAAAPSGTSSGALYKVTVPASGIPTSWPVVQVSSALNPRYLQSLGGGQTTGGKVYFTAGPENARTAWVTDGNTATQLSTAIVDESAGDGHIFGFSNGRVYFSAREPNSGSDNFELYQVNHATGATIQLKDINQTVGALGQAGSRPGNFTDVNGTLYFAANDGIHGFELWQTDGTAAGTKMAKASDANGNIVDEINPGPEGSNPGVVITTKTDTDLNGVSTTRLIYTYEGFAIANTRPDEFGVRNAGINSPNQLNPAKPNSGDDNGTPTLLFAATTPQYGRELWQVTPNSFSTTVYSATDTSKGTTTVIEGVSYDSNTNTVTFVFKGALQTINGVSLAQIAQGVNFTTGGVTYLFKSTVYTGHGTFAELVKDIAPGSRSSNPTNLTAIDGTVWMSADDGLSGDTLWTTIGLDQVTGNTLTIKLIDDATLFAGNSPLVNGIRNPDDFTFLSTNNQTISRVIFTAGNDLGKTEVYTLNINHTPTQLNLSSVAIPENMPQGTLVGTLGTADPDFGDSFQYKFVIGAGDTDNALFQIVGTSLQIKQPLDFETKSSYTVRIRTTDQRGQFYEKSFTVNVTDVNEAPTGIDLSGLTNTIVENTVIPPYSPATHVGGINLGTILAIDVDFPASPTNAFRIDPTSADAASFDIFKDAVLGWQLVYIGSSPDFETKSSYTIGILLDDPTVGGNPDVGPVTFTLNVTDADEYQIDTLVDDDLATNQVAENSAIGTPVGITARAFDSSAPLSVLGQIDGSETITYSLTNNAGGLFQIVNTLDGLGRQVGVVQVAGAINREPANGSYTITVQALSSDGTLLTQDYTIDILDVDEFHINAIRDDDAAADQVTENSPTDTVVGITAHAFQFTPPAQSDEPDATEIITYSLTDSAGGRFKIDSSTGIVTVDDGTLIDREQAASYTIIVQASSSDGSVATQSFTINVLDVDELHINDIKDIDLPAGAAVLENSPGGTTVGLTAHAYQLPNLEPDATEVITYSLTNTAGGRFQIDPSTGVVSVALGAVINREVDASFTITVRAVSSDGSIATRDFVIDVLDVNEFAVSPISDIDAAPNQVAENAATGTVVGITAFAFDADATTNGITYSLYSNASGRFQIDPVTGVVSVLDGSALDRENTASWHVLVQATSQDGSKSYQDFVINILDVNEYAVTNVFDIDPTPNVIPENSPTGTPVGITAFARDLDATNNKVTYSLFNTRGGRFAIDPNTGVVTVGDGSLLDAEAQNVWKIQVIATSQDGSKSVSEFTIILTDVNEYSIGQVFDLDNAVNAVDENAATGTTVGITAFANDLDKSDYVGYALTDDAGGRFKIVNTIDGTGKKVGVIQVNNGSLLNREAAASHKITVLAVSTDGSTSQKGFTIVVNDVNEFPVGPIANLGTGNTNILEHAAVGSQVGITANAVDPDATNNTVTYTLSDNAGGRFAINPITGVVTVASSVLLDRDVPGFNGQYTIKVKATSSDTSFSEKTFTINLIEVNDNPVSEIKDNDPTADNAGSGINGNVNEQAPTGTVVGITAFATDPDFGANGQITYSLQDTSGGRYKIDPLTGVVTVDDGTRIDFEAATTNLIIVKATSGDGSFKTKAFNISVNDVPEQPDLVMSNQSVNENMAAGAVVGVFGVQNATPTSPVYTLVSGSGSTNNGSFQIVGNQLRTRAKFNFEAKSSYSVRVKVTSSNGITTQKVFIITVNDVNEAPTGISLSGTSVKRSAPVGTAVGNFSAVDPDAGNTFTYSLVSGTGSTDNFRFLIVGNQLRVNGPLGTASSAKIRVRVTDQNGLWFEKTFSISLTA